MRWISRISIVVAWTAQACAGSRSAYPPVITHSNEPAVVAAVTGIALTAYAVGGGCKIADCPADTVCNPGSERCERIECSGPLAVDVCPASTQCSSSTGTCVPF